MGYNVGNLPNSLDEWMIPLEPPSAPEYTRVLVQVDARTLIKSVCRRCGAWKLVSHLDESLETWEATHQCCPDNQESAAK